MQVDTEMARVFRGPTPAHAGADLSIMFVGVNHTVNTNPVEAEPALHARRRAEGSRVHAKITTVALQFTTQFARP